jgi:exoribonuclease R
VPRRRFDLSSSVLRPGVEAIMREVGVPTTFPEQVAREAAAARPAPAERERVEIPFVTVDPPGSKDLDQALHIARLGPGFRVSYAIADVGALVSAGGPLDAEAHARGVTVYAPDAKAPLYPVALSEGSGSLLAGQWRPAILWTIDLDATGEQTAVDVRRAGVKSTAQHSYADLPAGVADLLAEVGGLRATLERERGGVSLRLPEQEVVPDGAGGWTPRYRAPLPSEDHNAQISLLTGMAAARLMLDSGVGILRTQQAPDERSFDRFRLQARALGANWSREQGYGDFIRSLDPTEPRQAALLQEAAEIGRGARYVAFTGQPPAELTDRFHFSIAADYAHATAPLRRLQDRYVSECCIAAVAGTDPPDWVKRGLAGLPELMQQGDRRAGAVERAVIDLVEALILSGREGERFAALVVDDDTVQLIDPAVRARVQGGCPEPGTRVRVRLVATDAAKRMVAFEVEAGES